MKTDLHPPCVECGRRWFHGHAADCRTRTGYSPPALPRVREVILSEADESWALEVARARNANGTRRGYRPKLGPGTDRAHSLGARGELAVARSTGASWDDPERLDFARMHDPDVGAFDVRTSERLDAVLPIRPGDRNDRPHVLVLALDDRRYRLAGWLLGREGKRPEFWRDADARGPGWWAVPQDALHDPWSLR